MSSTTIQSILDILKMVLPAGLAIFGIYVAIKALIGREFEKAVFEQRNENNKQTLSIKLQAYERLCLLLERIQPQSIIVRINEQGYNAAILQSRLQYEIREEFNHNLSQQVYISDNAWAATKSAVEEILSIVNEAGREVDPEAPAIELAKSIFEKYASKEVLPTSQALQTLKNEARLLL